MRATLGPPMDEFDRKLAELEAELDDEAEARARAEAEAEAAALEDEDDEASEDEYEEEDEEEDDEPPPPRRKRRKSAPDPEDDDEDDDGLDDASAAMLAAAGTHAGKALAKRAAKVAKQNLPALPSKSSVKEGAVGLVLLGFGGMIAWHYLAWLLVIPFMILKAGAFGLGLYGMYWVASKVLSEEDEPEDEEDL